ncbi:retrovirus-related pol polyprotein from transposon TNT 1-94 [Tanacetum coccineum]
MHLYGPMRVASINGKRYILVIVDDYSRFTWVRFLKTKDEAPAAIIKCIKNIQVRLNATIRNVRTDNGTEFVNQTLREWYENVGITHQTSAARTPQHNGVVERRNRTLVEAARTMLIFSKAPLFLWAEAINTACYTQNRSLICHRYNKTPYELMQDKKLDLSFFHVFGSLCYPTNDHEDLGKFDAKADIGIFVGYTPAKKAFRIYNRRTRIISETIHVTFDELTTMASKQFSLGPGLHYMTPAVTFLKFRFEGVTDWYQSQGYREPGQKEADDEEVSEGGIPRVIVLGYDGLPLQPVAPPSPDYIPGPENPQTPPVPQDEDEREPMFVQAHDPDYVPEPVYPEYIPLEDEHEFPAEEQPLPPIDSPTTESPGYVTESDPEEDPEEYEDDETEDGPVDYPMDGGDDGDDDDGDSSRDDANDEDEDEEDEEDEEEEEHLAPADSTTVIPADEPVFPPEGTEPVIPPPSTDITIGARITVRPQTSISLPPEAEVERLLTMTTPSPSPPISLSPPSAGERLARCTAPPAHSPPLPPSSGCLTQIQTLRIASTQALIDAENLGSIRQGIPEEAPKTVGRGPITSSTDLAELQGDMIIQDLYALLEDVQDRDSMDGRGGGLCFPRGLGSLDRIESGDPQELQTHRDHVCSRQNVKALRSRPVNAPVNPMAETLRPGPDARIPDYQDASGEADRTEGVVGLTRWIEKMESVFNISGCAIRIRENNNATVDFLIPIMGNVEASKPKTLDETIELANDLMDQKLCTYAEKSDNKRKVEDSSRNNHGHQQQPFKKQNVAKVYNMGTGEKKPYGGKFSQVHQVPLPP